MLDLLLSGEVAEARVGKRPIVALESTLVAHGMPWPDNLDTARALESEVRAHGAAPATIAVVDGKVRIGLDGETLERLARDGARFAKAATTDLAVHLARGANAATTVSATAVLAARAGIRVFATGGIGGVHRGTSGDVSHDLVALAKTPIAVVSAGAKAILDLAKTMEVLETLGVLVVGYRTDELPAFYTQRSGIRLDHFAPDARELATIMATHWRDLAGGGVLVCNPIPAADALDASAIEATIALALADAERDDVRGKHLTPFLLARVAAATAGVSIRANRALAINNARVAAELAVAFAAIAAVGDQR